MMFFGRCGDTKVPVGSLIIIKIMEIHITVDIALQHDGGQIGDYIDGEMKIHFNAVGVSELQVSGSLTEIPVLLVQADLSEDLAQ